MAVRCYGLLPSEPWWQSCGSQLGMIGGDVYFREGSGKGLGALWGALSVSFVPWCGVNEGFPQPPSRRPCCITDPREMRPADHGPKRQTNKPSLLMSWLS